MSTGRKRMHPARDADRAETRQALISNRHDAILEDCGDTLRRIEPLARLGEPIVGEPWPSDLHVDVQYRFDREPTRARRSLGIRIRVSKKSLAVLVLITTLTFGVIGRHTSLVKKMLSAAAKIMR